MTAEIHLIGGCGSSGSTLLAWLLDGLHDLRSGPETGLFHHRELYTSEDFPLSLGACLDDRAQTLSLGVNQLKVPLIPRVFFMDRDFHGLAQPDSEKRMQEAGTSLDAFLDFVLSQTTRTQGMAEPMAWVDQTPKNCIAAREFLEWRESARFIHLLRDGRDVMLSLARRWAQEAPGHPGATYLGAAAARWTFDIAQARRAVDLPGYLEVRYEDLVEAPLFTLNRILAHLGRRPIDEPTLENHQSPSALASGERFQGGAKDSWSASPGQEISTRGVGRWKRHLQPTVVERLMNFSFQLPEHTQRYCFGEQLEICGYA
jgi:hypothetical protein